MVGRNQFEMIEREKITELIDSENGLVHIQPAPGILSLTTTQELVREKVAAPSWCGMKRSQAARPPRNIRGHVPCFFCRPDPVETPRETHDRRNGVTSEAIRSAENSPRTRSARASLNCLRQSRRRFSSLVSTRCVIRNPCRIGLFRRNRPRRFRIPRPCVYN